MGRVCLQMGFFCGGASSCHPKIFLISKDKRAKLREMDGDRPRCCCCCWSLLSSHTYANVCSAFMFALALSCDCNAQEDEVRLAKGRADGWTLVHTRLDSWREDEMRRWVSRNRYRMWDTIISGYVGNKHMSTSFSRQLPPTPHVETQATVGVVVSWMEMSNKYFNKKRFSFPLTGQQQT